MKNRKIRVKIRDYPSKIAELPMGAPQGSPRSALMFIIYIQIVMTHVTYADDKIFIISADTIEECCSKCQNKLDELEQLAKKLGFQYDCKLTILGQEHEVTSNGDTSHLPFAGPNFTVSLSMKYLGLTFDESLYFDKFVDSL